MAVSIPSLSHTEKPLAIMPGAASFIDWIISSLIISIFAIFTSWEKTIARLCVCVATENSVIY